MKNPVQLISVIVSSHDLRRAQPRRLPAVIATLTICFGWFVSIPAARAVTPPPDGGYANETTAEGEDALFSLTTGIESTAVGYHALHNNLTGAQNTAVGASALEQTTSNWNTAIGAVALASDTSGTGNTAIGTVALASNTSGSFNTAIGFSAMQNNISGQSNVAVGNSALEFNTASNNTATGYHSLNSNSTGTDNTANGYQALTRNTTGFANVANGYNALELNTTGFGNTANGANSLLKNTNGSNNTANGINALGLNTGGSNNTADGNLALANNTTGSSNIALGVSAGSSLTTGSSNIDIGNVGVTAEANTIRIGKTGTQTNTYLAGIYGVTVSRGIGVILDSNGHLGTTTSSARFKDNIAAMAQASEAILSLRPVTFRYKHELDPDGVRQFGLVAEEVEKVDPELVARDGQGKPYSVRYEAVNAMLLNEFLKEHRRMEKLEATVARQQKDFQEQLHALTARLNAQRSQLRKASEQVQLNKPAVQLVVSDQ
jgi:trimeric autotransporter adhesin